jgi:hypothetical protein
LGRGIGPQLSPLLFAFLFDPRVGVLRGFGSRPLFTEGPLSHTAEGEFPAFCSVRENAFIWGDCVFDVVFGGVIGPIQAEQ